MNEMRTVPLSAIALALVASMVALEPMHAQAMEVSSAVVLAESPNPEPMPVPEPVTPEQDSPEVPHTEPAKEKESVRPAPALTPLEFKTPGEAAARAADPQAPTGAIIVLPAPKDAPKN